MSTMKKFVQSKQDGIRKNLPKDEELKKFVKPVYPAELTAKLYKKQMPDLGNHLEMVDKIAAKIPEMKTGGAKQPKQVVEGSRPVDVPANLVDISAKQLYMPGEAWTGSGKKPRAISDKMKNRSAKIKEIMKEKNLSMINASKYIKDHKIAY